MAENKDTLRTIHLTRVCSEILSFVATLKNLESELCSKFTSKALPDSKEPQKMIEDSQKNAIISILKSLKRFPTGCGNSGFPTSSNNVDGRSSPAIVSRVDNVSDLNSANMMCLPSELKSNVQIRALFLAMQLCSDKLACLYIYLTTKKERAYLFTLVKLLLQLANDFSSLPKARTISEDLKIEILSHSFFPDDCELIHSLLNEACDSSSTPSKSNPSSYFEDAYILTYEHESFVVSKSDFSYEVGSVSLTVPPRPLLIADYHPFHSYYSSHFFGTEHTNFVDSSPARPCVVSVKTQRQGSHVCFSVLVRYSTGDVFTEFLELMKSVPVGSEVLKHIRRNIPDLSGYDFKCFSSQQNIEVVNKLLKIEQIQTIRSFKFGILLQKDNQGLNEDTMYNNTSTPHYYEEFLDFLGTRISLDGWTKYLGGLDNSKMLGTGKQSLYTEYNGFEIMFHVATFLPYNKNESQQIERKRHVGNDIALIVFQDGSTPFDPSCLKSSFNSVFIIVRPDISATENDPTRLTHYRVVIAKKAEIKNFTPEFIQNYSFSKDTYFREFLLTKLINAEIACLKSSNFAPKLSKTSSFSLSTILH